MVRRWLWLVGIVGLIGITVAIYLLRPVAGPVRNLTLTADVTHGAYVMRLGGCVACHTAKGAKPLSGGAPLVTPFGTFVPPNITSDRDAGIGSWTLAEFSSALSDGVAPGGEHLYPAFPFDSYTLMTDQDVVDLFAALQAVPAIATPARKHAIAFPFNIRLAMLAWKNLFFHPARFAADPGQSDAWNRGAYLVNGPGHCVACHTPRNLFGARDDSHALAGSTGTPGGTVPAITTAALIDKGYDATILADVLNGGMDPEFDVPGGAMNEVITEGTAFWSAEDRAAAAEYLLTPRG